jgi:hypothetical protein
MRHRNRQGRECLGISGSLRCWDHQPAAVSYLPLVQFITSLHQQHHRNLDQHFSTVARARLDEKPRRGLVAGNVIESADPQVKIPRQPKPDFTGLPRGP